MSSQKSLFIVRHGKSSWDLPGVSDIDRPLKEKGIKNAYEIAETLNKKQLRPDIIYSSPAARAIQTAIIFSRVLKFPEEKFLIKNDLYLSDPEGIIEIIKGASPEVNSIMIFGHNPGFTDLTNLLSEYRLPNLPTAGMVFLQFSVNNWAEIDRSNLISSFYEFPGDN